MLSPPVRVSSKEAVNRSLDFAGHVPPVGVRVQSRNQMMTRNARWLVIGQSIVEHRPVTLAPGQHATFKDIDQTRRRAMQPHTCLLTQAIGHRRDAQAGPRQAHCLGVPVRQLMHHGLKSTVLHLVINGTEERGILLSRVEAVQDKEPPGVFAIGRHHPAIVADEDNRDIVRTFHQVRKLAFDLVAFRRDQVFQNARRLLVAAPERFPRR